MVWGLAGSILGVALATVLLVLGLAGAGDTLLYASIVASALAALALLAGVRRTAVGDDDSDLGPPVPAPREPSRM